MVIRGVWDDPGEGGRKVVVVVSGLLSLAESFSTTGTTFRTCLSRCSETSSGVRLGVMRACKIISTTRSVTHHVKLNRRSMRLTGMVKLLRSVKEFRRVGQFSDFRPKAVRRTTCNTRLLFKPRGVVYEFIGSSEFSDLVYATVRGRDSFGLRKVASREALLRTGLVQSTSGLSGYEMGLRRSVRALLRISRGNINRKMVTPGM